MQTKSRPGNRYITTAVYYLGFICLGMATAVLGPTLQGLAENTGSTLAQISSLFLVSSFGYLLGSFAAGRVFDRVKGHPIISLSLFIVAASLVVVPLIQRLLFLQAVFFIIGIAESHLDVGINALIVWLHGDRVPPFMNGLHAFYGIGTTTAPLIVAAVISNTGSLNCIYWALSILVLPVAGLILFFPSPSHIHSRQLAEERPAVPILVILISVIFFAFTGAELGFGGWIYTFTTSQVYGNPTLAASINAAFWAALTVGRVISIPLAVKFKPQKILGVNFCGVIVNLSLLVERCPESDAHVWENYEHFFYWRQPWQHGITLVNGAADCPLWNNCRNACCLVQHPGCRRDLLCSQYCAAYDPHFTTQTFRQREERRVILPGICGELISRCK
jgi:FHS family Na+ dependent glucose MFS transporter 1